MNRHRGRTDLPSFDALFFERRLQQLGLKPNSPSKQKNKEKKPRWLIGSPSPIQTTKGGFQRCHFSPFLRSKLQVNADFWGHGSRKITTAAKGSGKTLPVYGVITHP